jgi:hypothetical protein
MNIATNDDRGLHTVLQQGVIQSLLSRRVLLPSFGNITVWKAIRVHLQTIDYHVHSRIRPPNGGFKPLPLSFSEKVAFKVWAIALRSLLPWCLVASDIQNKNGNRLVGMQRRIVHGIETIVGIRINICKPIRDFVASFWLVEVKELDTVDSVAGTGPPTHGRAGWFAKKLDILDSTLVLEFESTIRVVTAIVVICYIIGEVRGAGSSENQSPQSTQARSIL